MDLKLTDLRREAKAWRKISPRVSFRLIALIELVKRVNQQGLGRAKELDYTVSGLKLGVSARSIRRWRLAYESGGPSALLCKPISGRPAFVLKGHLARQILEWRYLYQWGAEVIQAHLLHDHGVQLSRHKIERYFRGKGLLRKVRRKKKNLHTRKVSIATPGAFTQIDVKYVTKALKSGKRAYVYTFIDHASKWRFKRAFEMFGNLQTKTFVEELMLHVPFEIKCLQSDNGAEFTNRYLSHLDDPKPHILDLWCKSLEIRHKLIPPGEKELQGLVERNHRQDDEELYHRIEAQVESVAGLNTLIDSHWQWCNQSRRRKALGWRTANEWLKSYFADPTQENDGSADTPHDSLATPKAA